MERRKIKDSIEERDVRIKKLEELLEVRNVHIRALEEEIRALRGVVSATNRDPRFWMGFPIGLFDEPWDSGCPDRRKNDRQEKS